MRSHWLALAMGFVVLGIGITRWYTSRPAPTAPQATGPTAPEAGSVSNPVSRADPAEALPKIARPFEPILVLAESFTDPAGAAFDPFLGQAEESDYVQPTAPNPRPEAIAPRMPYADEELSEFAILLRRAAELRRPAAPVLSTPPTVVSSEETAELFPLAPTPQSPRCRRR